MTNLQYAIMEAYRDNLLSPEITIDMLEAAQGALVPYDMTDRYLKEVKEFEDKVVAPAKNSNWWTSEHTAKVNTYLSKIKALYLRKSTETFKDHSSMPTGETALNGLRVAIRYELPANKFKFITKADDVIKYELEAGRIRDERDDLIRTASKDGYDREVAKYHKLAKQVNDCGYPEARKTGEDMLKSKYGEDGLKTLHDRREAAKKKLASVYGIHIA